MPPERRNTLKKILLFGGGLHAQTCIDVIEKQGLYELAGIIDSVKDIGSSVDNYPVIGRINDLEAVIQRYNISAGFIGIGDNWSRKMVYDQIISKEPHFEFVNLIHPSAVTGKNVQLGKGVLIGAQSFVSSDCSVGNFVLLHQKSHIGLQNKINDFASVSLGSITGGKVEIGKYSAATIGVIISDRTKIGPHTVIGSGSLVLNDLPGYVMAYGHPAKIIRSRESGERYLKSGS
jgi:sugar O-acyltransferase (sialic acid O-acetyltransferase NeuD family)